MANPENKQIPYESTQQDIRDAIESVATAIGGIAVPSADHVSYDNSGSGLSATDVQNALDEIVSDIPTVNNGTLTIQQNGTSKGSFTANSASNVNVNIETPTADKKTATDQFTTADGGLLSKCQINLVPVQSGSGDPSPDNVRPISGHTEVDLYNVGKNRLSLDISTIKSLNTSGTWNGNEYTYRGVTFTINTDSSGNIISVKANNTASGNAILTIVNSISLNENYIVSGCPIGGSYNSSYSIWAISQDPYNEAIDSGNGVTITSNYSREIRIRIASGYNAQNLLFKPMIRLATDTDSAFEPYLGHLYQVQIGSTVYGGYVDLVSGVMVATHAIVTYDGSNDESWNYSSAWSKVNTTCFYLNGSPAIYFPSWDYKSFNYCNELKCASRNEMYDNDYLAIGMSGAENSGVVTIRVPSTVTDVTQLRTWLTTNPIQATYELATPLTIQLTPQQIETLAGQNNLSTPLSGQSIETNGVEYKELFTFADVKEYVKPLIPYSNAGSHNAIYRGKYLGDHVTPEQWASIVAGTFDDLFIGDYWTINSVNWRIAHFDYWLGTGDMECTDHHVVIVPDTNLYNAKMNSSNTTAGGYYSSEMHGGADYLVSGSSNLYQASEDAKSAFVSSHILTHRERLTNAVSGGNASGSAWYDSSVDLMSEVMVYGTLAWSNGGKGYEVGNGKGQFALFVHDISRVTNHANWWLRGVSSATDFVHDGYNGVVSINPASYSLGVRPCFAIK